MVIGKGGMRARARALAIALGMASMLALALAPGAQARSEYEPNDSRETAYGPLTGAQWFTAEQDTVNDDDWYYFYVKTYSQLEFSGTMVKAQGCETDFYLYDRDGNLLKESYYFEAGELNTTERFFRTMEPGRYYIKVPACYYSEGVGDRYKFKIDPAGSLTTNRECGEAIVTRDTVIPLLTKATVELEEVTEPLAAADAAVRESKGELGLLKSRWEKAKVGWEKIKRRIKRHPESPRFQNRERRRLRISRARVNSSLSDAKGSARAKLDAANKTRTAVLAKQAPLKEIVAQHTNAKTQAEAQIAINC